MPTFNGYPSLLISYFKVTKTALVVVVVNVIFHYYCLNLRESGKVALAACNDFILAWASFFLEDAANSL